MRNRRLLLLGVAIALALGALYLVRPAPPPAPAAAVVAQAAPSPAAAAPAEPAPARAEPEPEPAPEPTPPPAAAVPAAPAPAEAEAPAEPPAEPADAGTPPADADHAADLFAAQLAEQEAEPENGPPNPARDLWKRFDKEEKDDAWAGPAGDHLDDALDEWLDALPEGTGDHLALVHVECRATLCQILAADNDLAGQSARAEAGQEWQQALAGLRTRPWWNELGFTGDTTQVATRDGYTLYTTYLERPPPAPAKP